jgi:RNA polymerase subunit RPABC4/transcription elongation factor Spt4
MKKALIWGIFEFLVMFMGCATMGQATNIQPDSEFIPCDDVSCTVCGGTGQLDCDTCDASGLITCTECNGSGEIPCEGNLATNILGLTCKNGWSYVMDPDSYTGTMDSEGYAIDTSNDERIECLVCEGSAVRNCRRCDGDGLVDCNTCDGAGYLLHGTTISFSTCQSCGERLAEGATQCTNCGLNAIVYKCKDCGASFNEELEICPECGAGA